MVSATHRSSKRGPARPRRLAAACLALAASLAGVVAAAPPATAAGPWYVATNGNNGNNCLSAATPCLTVTGALAKAGFQAGDTINVAPGTYTDRPIINKRARIVGAGTGATFTGVPSGTTAWAMAVTVAGATELQNITLTSGGYQTGGAFVATAGTIKATDVSITNSKAINGGGVYLFVNSSLEMVRGKITGNTATATAANVGWGGAAYVAAGASLKLDGTLVENNKAVGGSFGLAGLAGAIVSLGSVTATDTVFRGNEASGTGSLSGYGGAIYNNGTAFQLDNSDFEANKAVVGGALVDGKPITATNVDFTNNVALAAGGIYTSASVTLNGGSFTGNQATLNYAGGIFGVGTTAAPVTLVLDSVDASGNSAPTGGGVLATTANVTTTVRNGSVFADNTSQSGGAVYNSGTLTVKESVLRSNDASALGGALFNGSGTAADTPKATLTDAVVEDNTSAFVGGGVVNATNATLTVTGGRIDGNSAVGGGGVVVADVSTATIDGTQINDNVATGSGGGGLLNSGNSTVRNATFDGNEAIYVGGTSGIGGAIYNGSNTANVVSKLDLEASTLSHNRGYGGSALVGYSTNGATSTTTIDRSTISGNVSSSVFGAIEQVAQPMTITNSTITDNVATGAGGAGALATSGPTGIRGTVFAGNTPSACAGSTTTTITNNGANHAGPGNAGCGPTPGVDPQLSALADNGGPTLTQLPSRSSVLLDKIAGPCGGDAVDQRGLVRPSGAKCDIGAVERAQVVGEVNGPDHVDLAVGSPANPAASYTTTGSPVPTLTAGPLPAGLTFTDNGDGTGTINGTPTGPGGLFPVTITATNEAGSIGKVTELEIHQAPTLTGPTAATYTVGQPGGPDVFSQSGGHPRATLSTNSALPGGVTFTDGEGAADGTGTLAGTPVDNTGGTYAITIKGANGTGPDASWPFALTVNEAPELDAPAAATFRVGTAGSSSFDVDGFPAPVVTASGLPNGLAVNGSAVSGTPANGTGGVYDVILSATNGVGDDATDTVEVTVEEAASIAGPAEVRMVASSTSTFEYAGGGFPEPTLTATGALPDGVTFVDNGDGTATLAGTPAGDSVGTYSFTITAVNGIGAAATKVVSLEVVDHVSIVTTTLPDAAVGAPYDVPLMTQGGLAPYTFELSGGSLPAGLSLTGDGRIVGTPTGAVGSATFTVKVTDSDSPEGEATRQLTITVGKGTTSLTVAPLIVLANGISYGKLSAVLVGGFPPQSLAGQTVKFTTKGLLGNTVLICTGVTNAFGVASCDPTLLQSTQIVVGLGITGTYAGDARWKPSEGRAGIL
ncbi:MAG: putative Ig domain-containing protein [Propionibacteriales bacterium]|nr:putative Ig domain-containing protein [Propionibacteriales bacterium]